MVDIAFGIKIHGKHLCSDKVLSVINSKNASFARQPAEAGGESSRARMSAEQAFEEIEK
jgi:hypothetical protein